MSQRQVPRLHSETPEKRQDRMQNMSTRRSISLELETEQERQERLIKESQSKKRLVSVAFSHTCTIIAGFHFCTRCYVISGVAV